MEQFFVILLFLVLDSVPYRLHCNHSRCRHRDNWKNLSFCIVRPQINHCLMSSSSAQDVAQRSVVFRMVVDYECFLIWVSLKSAANITGTRHHLCCCYKLSMSSDKNQLCIIGSVLHQSSACIRKPSGLHSKEVFNKCFDN